MGHTVSLGGVERDVLKCFLQEFEKKGDKYVIPIDDTIPLQDRFKLRLTAVTYEKLFIPNEDAERAPTEVLRLYLRPVDQRIMAQVSMSRLRNMYEFVTKGLAYSPYPDHIPDILAVASGFCPGERQIMHVGFPEPRSVIASVRSLSYRPCIVFRVIVTPDLGPDFDVVPKIFDVHPIWPEDADVRVHVGATKIIQQQKRKASEMEEESEAGDASASAGAGARIVAGAGMGAGAGIGTSIRMRSRMRF